jgi:group I intron endonuclease
MTIGIYSITNTVNNKRYIGKSSNIERRFWYHRNHLSKDCPSKKAVNRHLVGAWKKYGEQSFTFDVIETFDTLDEAILANRELHWMDFYNTCNREFGYNLRRDSSTKTTTHPETAEIHRQNSLGENNPNYGNYWSDEQKLSMSEKAKARWATGEHYTADTFRKMGEKSSAFWANNPEVKAAMKKKVAKALTKYRFNQFDKHTGELVKCWESMDEIITANPDYFKIAIYSVCNGHKKTYRGYFWEKELKNECEVDL